jgi:hypothetical protein
LSYVATLLISALGCKSREGAWYNLNYIQSKCFKAKDTPLLAFVMILEFSSEILLVVSPLVMLWKIKLPAKERRLILALFSSSLASLLAEISFMVAWYLTAGSGLDSHILVSMFMVLQVSHPKTNSPHEEERLISWSF